MKQNKPRHNPDKPQNRLQGHCPYDDGSLYKECNNPWANHCDGNRYKCYKLYLQHLATLSDEKKAEFTEHCEKFGLKNGAPRTNL